jgi:LuxR family transcriptional regulator, maltose regulon positive regulatory protein
MSNAEGDSRLIVPPLPPRYISRRRLLAALDAAVELPLTLLSAGPGAGKTVLLADWVLRKDAPVAWIAPAAADATPRRFWRLLWSALQAYGVLDGPPIAVPPGDTAGLLDSLLDWVPTSPDPLVLIIDDAHVLTHPEVLDVLDAVIRGWHPRLRLVLAARSDPLLPLHRYRLAGQMRELRALDLAMTPPEMREALAARGVTLSPRDFDTLATRTEGWAAGVQLSAMRMEGTERPAEFLSELALDQGSVGEYLIAEVLQRQPGPLRRLLVETSFLGEVTGPLAEAITGMDGCAEMLVELARWNSFVIPLDAAQTRFRYHHLFAEILRCLLQQQMRREVPALLKRAAAHFKDTGDLGNALYWAVQAGDQPYVASLLAHGGLSHAFVHRQDLSGTGLRDLLPPVPEDGGAGKAAESTLASSAIAAVIADAGTAARELQRVHDARLDEQLPHPDLVITSHLIELILGLKAGNARAVDSAADRLLARSGHVSEWPVPGLPAAVLLAQASSHLWHGRHGDVGALLRKALAQAEREGPPGLELEVLAMIAYVASYWSWPRRADDAALRARALLCEHGNLSSPPALELADAIRSFAGADFAGAGRALQRALVPDAVGSDPGLAAAVTLGHASVLLGSGQVQEARTVLAASGRPSLPLLAAHHDIILADIETGLGRPHAALRLLREHQGGEFAILAALPRARAFLALRDLRSAEDCVRCVLATSSDQAARCTLVEAMLCGAQIAQSRDEPGRALEMIIGAIEVAHGEIILPFFQVTEVFATLLARHPAVAAQWPAPLTSGAAQTAGVAGPAIAGDLAEPLTQRERAVLRFLSTSMSTAEIADELCLSVNTVKTHMAAIYRKLAIRRRREAVLRARQLELI